MSRTITFQTRSERAPTLVAALVFLVPGVSGLILGPLTWFGLTWIENPANGLMIGFTCAVWSLVGLGLLRFRRWITVDAGAGVVERGTRTLFRHPSQRFQLASFDQVQVRSEKVGDSFFYVAALSWKEGQRPRGTTENELWLHTWAEAAPARGAARQIADLTGLPLADRTA